MNDQRDILFGTASQVVYFDCPEGRPSAVTSVTCYEDIGSDESDAESAITGSPSIESVNLTLNATSGKGEQYPELINLASVAGLVIGRQFLLTSATGETEWPEIARIDTSGTSAYARSPLMNTYSNAATLQSCRLLATIDTDWASDENNLSNPCETSPRYRLAWLYTVAGIVYRATSFFDLTRYPFQCTVTPTDVNQLSRGWLGRLHPDDQVGAGEAIIREARRQVRVDLLGRRLTESAQRNNLTRNELIRRKAIVLVAESALLHGSGNSVGVVADVGLERAEREYNAALERLVPTQNVQLEPDGGAGKVQQAAIWRR